MQEKYERRRPNKHEERESELKQGAVPSDIFQPRQVPEEKHWMKTMTMKQGDRETE